MKIESKKKTDLRSLVDMFDRLDPIGKEKMLSYGQGMADAVERMTATHRQT